jgi:membrane-bound serine protease (ClpP class)
MLKLSSSPPKVLPWWENVHCFALLKVLLFAAIGMVLAGWMLESAFTAPAQISPRNDEDALSVKQPGAEPPRTAVQERQERVAVGYLLRVKLPIDGQSYQRAKLFVRKALERARSRNQQPILIFHFQVRPDQKEYGRGSEFGASSDLARFLTSSELRGARTVAYISQSLQGHAVLVALACDEIIMAPEAEIGPAGVDERIIEPDMRSTYEVIANRRRTFPPDVALGLLDPALEILEVKTDLGTEYVRSDRLEELRKQKRTILGEPKVLIPAGQPGRFTGEEARRLRFIGYLASDMRELARALDLAPESIEEDLALSENWTPIGVTLKGPITSDKVRRVQRIIEDAIRDRRINLVILEIHSPGGSISESIQLANFLGPALKKEQVHTVAYVPSEARADASLVALACSQLVVHPEAILGGPGGAQPSKDDLDLLRKVAKNPEGPWAHRGWSSVLAMVDADMEMYEYVRRGQRQLFSLEEMEELSKRDPTAAQWIKGQRVSIRGGLKGAQAGQLGLADFVVRDFAELQKEFSLEEGVPWAEPGWAQHLIDLLARPEVAGLLLAIGFFALYFELHTPGVGLGGFIATVCFLLFFWSRFLGGTAGWLEVLLFLAGVACLLLEIFVLPGFGIFGLGGGLLIIASLILASQTFVIPRNEYQVHQSMQSLMILIGAFGGVLILAWMTRKWLPRMPVLGRMFLPPPEPEEAEQIRQRERLADYTHLVGAVGIATTRLVPSGKARFGNELVDVTAEGELIERGQKIIVTEVQGYRVIVRPVEEPPPS